MNGSKREILGLAETTKLLSPALPPPGLSGHLALQLDARKEQVVLLMELAWSFMEFHSDHLLHFDLLFAHP